MIPYLFIYSDWALLALRFIVAAVFIARGLPKFTNLHKTARRFNDAGFFPGFFWGTGVAMLEVFGGFFLGVGLFTQIMALLFILLVVVALLASIKNRDFRGAYDSNLILLAVVLALAAVGPGAYSADAFFRIIFLW